MASHPRRSLVAAVASLLLAVLLAACGGAATGSPSGSPGGSAAATSAAPSETAPASASGGAQASFDISSLDTILKSVSTLDSYQADTTGTNLSAEVTDFKSTAIVIRKGDPSESELLYEKGVLKFGVVFITSAGTGWATEDGKTWNKVPLPTATQLMGTLSFSDPGVVLAAILTDKVKPHLQLVGAESKNGQQTAHFRIDAASLPPDASFPPDGQADLWISADGKYLVAATFSGTEQGRKVTFDYELTHVNDSSLKVTPPI